MHFTGRWESFQVIVEGGSISRGLHLPPFSYPHHIFWLPLTFTWYSFSHFFSFLSLSLSLSPPLSPSFNTRSLSLDLSFSPSISMHSPRHPFGSFVPRLVEVASRNLTEVTLENWLTRWTFHDSCSNYKPSLNIQNKYRFQSVEKKAKIWLQVFSDI